jgi:hypothetical protein
MGAPDKQRPTRAIAEDLARLWGLPASMAVPDLAEKLQFRFASGASVWDELKKFGVPATFKEDAAKALRQLLKLRRRYGRLLGKGSWGPTTGDGLDTAINRLELWAGIPRPDPRLQPIKRAVVEWTWRHAPPGKRKGKIFDRAVSLVNEEATGVPNQKLDRTIRAVRKGMRTSPNKK